MREVIRFLYKYYFILLFAFLQAFSLFLIIQFNSFQRASFFSGISMMNNRIYHKLEQFTWYLNLREENLALVKENLELRSQLPENFYDFYAPVLEIEDTLKGTKFAYISAMVVNNSTNKQFNYILIDKGSKAGVQKNDAVVSNDGVVGQVFKVSENYSLLMSVLNVKVNISGKIKSNGYFGTVNWNGKNAHTVLLHDIPYHVTIIPGDSIVTSGYSSIFPEGILIGSIADYKLKGGNFYEVEVNLSNEFRKLNNVYVVKNLHRNEILDIQTLGSTND